MNEIKIQVPEGMQIDEENSTFECIKFKPKELTYDDIAKKLFVEKSIFYIDSHGDIEKIYDKTDCLDLNNAPTRKQCERLLAINQLMNVAYYFNEIVDKDVELIYKFIPEIGIITGRIICNYGIAEHKGGIVYFKTKASFDKAIKILGEETVKLALSL